MENLLKEIQEKDTNNMYLLNKEKLISDVLAYLEDKSNPILEKIIILQYLSKCITNIPFNSEILLNHYLNNKRNKSLYHIIILQYIINYENKEYSNELKNLFSLLMKNISYNKSIYQYIISFISNYINKQSLLLNDIKDINIDENYFEEDININDFNSNHLLAILELIYAFYEKGQKYEEPYNYFYFSGQQNNNIIINNTNSILDLKNDIYILLFVKLVDINYLNKFDKLSLLEIQLNNYKSININIISDGYNTNQNENIINIPYSAFSPSQINQVIIKINKNSQINILINNKVQQIPDISAKEKNIESLVFFNDFIGCCTNIMIYKNNTNETFIPKFISNELYKSGIFKEELFSAFVKGEMMNEIDENNIKDKNIHDYKESDLTEIKTFVEKNLISIYIPIRYEKSFDSPVIYIKDSINGLDGDLNIDSPLSGIHSLEKTIKAFYNIGSINHLLPIIELINKNENLSNSKIFDIFMDIINFIFTYLSDLFQLMDKNSQFFFYFSHFLEKIPEKVFGEGLNKKLRLMSIVFLAFKDDNNYQLLIQQFLEYIFLNENILFKFSFELQKNIIEQIIVLINETSKTRFLINIDIVKIIKILLYYDSQRYNKYCCKEHAEYFLGGKEKEIMSPELKELILPVINLLKELFKRLSLQFKHLNKDIKSLINSNRQINDYNLDKLFSLLTFDISPCLQKTILTLFYDLKSKPNELYQINKNGKFLYILLFLLKTTVFNDIKSLAFDFTLLLFNENITNPNNFNNLNVKNSNINTNINIRQYLECNLLPYYLLIDERAKKIKVMNVSGEIDQDKFMEFFFINNIKYNYLVLSPQQEKLNANYNKVKLDELINTFFDKIYNNFNIGQNPKMNLNILIKIVSKADITLIIRLLDNIKQELDSKARRYIDKYNEIFENNNFFHWLLETCFHAYLLRDAFNNNIDDGYNFGFKFPSNMDEKEKKNNVGKILEKSNDLIINILNNNIYKLDIVITWSKYYYEFINEENSFKLIRNFVYELIFQKIILSLKEIFQPNITSNKVQRTTLYFYNIIFEYYTYFKISANLNNEDTKDVETLYQEISTPFKYNILTELKKELKSNFSEDIYDTIPKLPFYTFMKKVYTFFSPLWFDEKKKIKNDKDFYKTYIYHKQNIFVNELEFLFYSFRDITELQQTDENIYIYGNKGIPLIYILFHQFTIFLTLINDSKVFKELIENFRLLISLVIISSCTLTIFKGKPAENKQVKMMVGEPSKINWPSEEQYKKTQKKVHLFLFNCFYFLYYKIIEINTYLKKFEGKKDKIDNLNKNKKYVYDTICYFLRLLITILKERKIHEEDKKKHNFKMMFSAIKKMIVTKTEGVPLSGPYLFILEFYTKCFINNKTTNTNAENFDLNNYILKTKTFMDDIPIYNIDDMLKDTSNNYIKLYPKIEKCGNAFMSDENIKKYFDQNVYENQKILFPFLNYILKRKELLHNIIPIYDNSFYCKYKYNSLCLLTNYYPDYPFDKSVINNTIKINESLSEDIRFSQMKSYFDNYDRITKYYKIKKRLFTFNGLWSKKEFFYNEKKYGLKHKIFNHLTEDYTKIFLTPIIDIDYYLPKFSSFNTNELFRSNNGEIVSLKKITDLSSDSIDRSPNNEKYEGNSEDNNEEIKEKEQEKDDLYIYKDIKEDQLNNLYLLKKVSYKFVENLSEEEKNSQKHYKLFISYVNKINNINLNDFCSSEISCLVKTSYHVKGVFYNNYKEIGFYAFDKIPIISQEEYDQERKACFGSVFGTQKRKYDGYHLKIPYNQIAFVLKRRYFFRTIALEIYTLKNKSYYFKFDQKNIKKVYDNIKHQMKSTIEDIQIEYSKIDSKIGFINNNDNSNLFINTSMLMYKKKDMNLRNLYEKWSMWEISTLKFLMMINIYANRSLNDVNQYPVFPWIITDYTESDYNKLLNDPNLIRPFGVPMGMMDIREGAAIRKNNFLEHWKSMEEEEEKLPNYDRYGTHYSTSLYVSYYLVRSFPFSNIRIELQGSKFDDPNRLFLTVENSFNMALTQKTDLRELIPELFCFPEMFYNSNNFNLGELTENPDNIITEENTEINENNEKLKKIIVNDVKMPNWSNNNGYIFIQKHRELLESPEVSDKINEWFNIIFGSKQKGPAAKKIHNLFLDQTYDDYEEQHNKSSIEEKINQFRLIEFGVTPNQIFKYDTSKRKLFGELKNKKQLLYNTTEAIKKDENSKNFLNFEEIDCDFNEEKPYRIFDFQKEGYKKWRIYILTKDNVKIFKKKVDKVEIETEGGENNENKINEKPQIVKDPLSVLKKIKDTTTKINIIKKSDIKLSNYKYRLNNENVYYNCSLIFGKGSYVAMGGFWNGNIIIKSLDYKSYIKGKDINKLTYVYTTNEISPITIIIIDETETYAICANKIGNIFVFFISPEKKYKWLLSKILCYHKTEITSIALSENLNIFISCSKDGNCMLYSLPRIKLFNSWNIRAQNETNEISDVYCSLIIIFHTPLPCFIFYLKNLNSLYVYSINGKILKKHKLEYEIINKGIAKYIDYQMKDYLLIYNSNDKTVDIYRGIDFEFITKSPVINYNFIDFVLSKGLDQILILVENNNKDEQSNSKYKILVLKDKENQLLWK